jgi:hypothetical protein
MRFISFIFGMIFSLLSVVVIEFALWIGLLNTQVFDDITIYFYRGLACLALTLPALIAILLVMGQMRSFKPYIQLRDILPISTAACAITLAFFSLGPVVIDRSNSILILRNLEAHNQPQAVADISDEFIKSYVRDLDQINRRLSEQMASGMITQQGDGYVLTTKGHMFMQIARLMSSFVKTDPRFVSPPPSH